ncbi:MAG: UDP-N-acetylmuramate dehydrogenase, partial [Alphaproteobacteria bacterium]|nr:UDP-N-acetylmuramate dehydrogenase [Alphaproteobacteria bacterium]
MRGARMGDALIARLPDVRGRLQAQAPLAPHLWFRAGGPAEALFRPKDVADLQAFLATCPADVPLTVIGVGSNLLVRDGGVPGVVIRLGGAFAQVAVESAHVRAGAGALDVTAAETAAQAGLAGLEFLCGIPGTIGGALRMNAGAYGREIKDVLVSAVAIDRRGRRHEVTAGALGMSYRHCAAPEDWIFVEALLQGSPDARDAVAARMAQIRAQREASQPVRARTGGSTFTNPAGHKAWELIDRAGCRGLKRGGAQVSEKHANFLINAGDASAADIEALGEEVRARVKAATGVVLEW